MSVGVAVRIARRELRGGLQGFRVFLACLALGVAAIAAIGTVRASIEAGLAREAARLLGGDAVLEFTYRFADADERAWMAGAAEEVAEIVDFRSMAVVPRAGGAERALTQVKAVDAAYPLYGTVTLAPDMPLALALDGRDGLPGAVMERVLADRLGLAPGDRFRLGTRDFVLMAILTGEPDAGSMGFGLGPRTILRTADLSESGLLAPGTLFETEYYLRLPEGVDLAELESRAAGALGDRGMRWHDLRNGTPGVARFVERLSAFLILVGLAGLAVGGVGVSVAVSSYLDRKTAVIATLKTLGAERRTVHLVYFLQIGALTGLGLALGLAVGGLAPVILAPAIEAQLPVPAVFAVYPRPVLEAALYGVLVALLFALWPLARVDGVRPAALFRDADLRPRRWPPLPWIAVTGALLLVLVGAAAILSGLVSLVLWFATGLVATFATLLVVAELVRGAARRVARLAVLRGRTALRPALAALGGPGQETVPVMLSLGIGLAVLAAIGQIDVNLRGAIARELPAVAPAYFAVDIQPGQLSGFRALLAAEPGVGRVETAPMLRGVVTGINGRPAAEVAGDHWVVRGDRGITFFDSPPEGTVLTAGRRWPDDYDGPPLVSVAAEEAEEIGLALGDRLTVNVLGRDIEAEIASFRKVDFSSAGIGFVLAMNRAALEDAPHSHIATIYADPAAEPRILGQIGNAYPNVTAIRVRDAIDRVSAVLAGISDAVMAGALAVLVTGGLVLIGAATVVERARTFEAAVLRTLGASRGTILLNFALRSAGIGAVAGGVAVLAGSLAGWAVTQAVFEIRFTFDAGSAAVVVVAGVALTLATGAVAALRPLSVRPARVLRARE